MSHVNHILTAKSALLLSLRTGKGNARLLVDRMISWSGGKVKILHQSVYNAIRSLEEDGFIKKVGRSKCCYELTYKGEKKARELWFALKDIVEEGC